MKRVATAVSILTAALFIIGCGGGGTASDTKVRVNLTGADWAGYAASPWKEINMSNLPADGIFSFEPAQDGRYSVAIHCKEEGNKEIILIHATRNELPVIDALCEDSNAPRYYVTGTAYDVNGSDLDRLEVYMSNWRSSFDISGKKDVNYSIKNIGEGTHDLVVFKSRNVFGNRTIYKYGIKRDIYVDKNVSGQDINLSSEGIAAVEHNFTVTGSSDSFGYGFFITSNGTVAADIGHTQDGGTGNWFALGNGARNGDTYMFIAADSIDYDTKIIFDGKDAVKDPGDITYEPGIIAALDVNVTYDGNISGLNYMPASQSPALRLYDIFMEQNGDDMREIWITAGWLGSADSYTLPGLEALKGWNTEWSIDKGMSRLNWEVSAIMADKTFSEALNKMVISDSSELPLFGLEMTMHWAIKGGESLNPNVE